MAKLFHDFTIPEKLRYEGGPAVVSLQLLSSDQELIASRLGRFDVLKTQYEAVKLSVGALDGAKADPSTGIVDTFWEKAGPKVRSLLLQAYDRISSPTKEDESSFFLSEKARVVD